mmetsp:Transcript_51378/g.155627  ORF Transcript_51378/g.155627 Transcript_51378/m.155627 type:complete len:219 (+) Transcript_51378:355-1011(+)
MQATEHAICVPNNAQPPPQKRPPSKAKTPVSTAPRRPPTPCKPKASRASSSLSTLLSNVTAKKQTGDATTPMAMAPSGLTKPAAGVMTTRPDTAPTMAAELVAVCVCSLTMKIMESMAAAAARHVVAMARAATASAARAEPALKPIQPNQSSPPPRRTNGTLKGLASLSRCWRGPSNADATRPDTPELMCTTVPPAKSRAPISRIQPCAPQTQWHRGT